MTYSTFAFFRGLAFFSFIVIFLPAQAQETTIVKKNEISLSLNSALITLLGQGLQADVALYYTRRIDPHWAWRTGIAYRNEGGPFFSPGISGFDSDGLLQNTTFQRNIFSGKIGFVRYTKGKVFKGFYGLDLGYQYRANAYAAYYYKLDSIGRTGRGRIPLEKAHFANTEINALVLSPIIGIRADINRHFALSAEFSPDITLNQYTTYDEWWDESYTITQETRETSTGLEADEGPGLITRLNLIFKF